MNSENNVAAKNLLIHFNDFVKAASVGLPGNIRAGYHLSGDSISKDNEIAFIASLTVAAMIDERYQPWLDSLWTYIIHPPRTMSMPIWTNWTILAKRSGCSAFLC